MQRLGQHFLKNLSVTEKIIDALALKQNDVIIEIGPGHGELTTPLIHAAAKVGGTIFAIERDRSLLPELETLAKETAAEANDFTLKIIEGDALKKLSEVAANIHGIYKITGNIPYYITGHLLRVISELPRKPAVAVLMVQKEVAIRACAVAPEMNRLAASIQFWADPKMVVVVPKTDFSPPPKVDSAVIMLSLKDPESSLDSERYYRAVRAIFSQPRKTILNNIAHAMENGSKNNISAGIKECDVDPEGRPQNLSVANISSLAAKFF
jgi:16S rRNA (adenine1518-N6/adenine1519-N6)-dimethyltransferase